jgi:hypothetical protein
VPTFKVTSHRGKIILTKKSILRVQAIIPKGSFSIEKNQLLYPSSGKIN